MLFGHKSLFSNVLAGTHAQQSVHPTSGIRPDLRVFSGFGFFCSQSESRPAHLRVTPAVGRPLAALPSIRLSQYLQVQYRRLFMGTLTGQPLKVTIQDLMPIPIAYMSCQLQQATGSYSEQIRDGFQRIKDWARQHGYDLSKLRVIGIHAQTTLN